MHWKHSMLSLPRSRLQPNVHSMTHSVSWDYSTPVDRRLVFLPFQIKAMMCTLYQWKIFLTTLIFTRTQCMLYPLYRLSKSVILHDTLPSQAQDPPPQGIVVSVKSKSVVGIVLLMAATQSQSFFDPPADCALVFFTELCNMNINILWQ